MQIHFINMLVNQGKPLCWGDEIKNIAIMGNPNIMNVTCVDCLRILALNNVM